MGRLIDEDAVLTLVADRVGNRYIIENIRKLPTVDAIPIKNIAEALEKIDRVANSGQWNEAVCFGLRKAKTIIQFAMAEEDDEQER